MYDIAKYISLYIYVYVCTYLELQDLSKEEVHVGKHESCDVLLRGLRYIAHISPFSSDNPYCLSS